MVKIVRYVGDTANGLVYNKEYEVSHTHLSQNGHPYFIFDGIDGMFDSIWFEDVKPTNSCVAISFFEPVVGKPCSLFQIQMLDTTPSFIPVETNLIESVEKIEKNIYKVTTVHSIYFVQVV